LTSAATRVNSSNTLEEDGARRDDAYNERPEQAGAGPQQVF
jgi:hypothetical protein